MFQTPIRQCCCHILKQHWQASWTCIDKPINTTWPILVNERVYSAGYAEFHESEMLDIAQQVGALLGCEFIENHSPIIGPWYSACLMQDNYVRLELADPDPYRPPHPCARPGDKLILTVFGPLDTELIQRITCALATCQPAFHAVGETEAG